jgi:hypothetical protein
MTPNLHRTPLVGGGKHTGAINELAACQYFLSKGYEVFRNVSQHGPADLAIWHKETNEFTLVDVKTVAVYYKKNGEPIFYSQKSKNQEILVLAVSNGVVLGFQNNNGDFELDVPRGGTHNLLDYPARPSTEGR